MDLLFDLDNTIINSECAKPYREQRNWRGVYSQIPEFEPFGDLIQILHQISENHNIYIVTSSPSKYAEIVCSTWDIPYRGLTAYHDTRLHKPHPEPYLRTLSHFGLNAVDCLSFGDDSKDIAASRAAKIRSVACLWGALDKDRLINSNPDHLLNQPEDLKSTLDQI